MTLSAKSEGILIFFLRVPDLPSPSKYSSSSYPPKRPVESYGRILKTKLGFFAPASHLPSTVL